MCSKPKSITERKKPLLSRRGLGWLSEWVAAPPPLQGRVRCPWLPNAQTSANHKKKGRPDWIDLEEAATYSPTGKPQYHRRR